MQKGVPIILRRSEDVAWIPVEPAHGRLPAPVADRGGLLRLHAYDQDLGKGDCPTETGKCCISGNLLENVRTNHESWLDVMSPSCYKFVLRPLSSGTVPFKYACRNFISSCLPQVDKEKQEVRRLEHENDGLRNLVVEMQEKLKRIDESPMDRVNEPLTGMSDISNAVSREAIQRGDDLSRWRLSSVMRGW